MKVKKLEVDVIGVSPPCTRCKKTEENARKAAARLSSEGYKVGVLMSPAIAVNGTVKFMGKVLDVGVIERLLRQEI